MTGMAIGFASETRKNFDVVAQHFGLSCLISNESEVRYENDDVYLIVNFDNGRSYELGVEVGRKKSRQQERPFSLAEVLRLRGVADAQSADGAMASNADALGNVLAQLARLTLMHAEDFLMGNDLSFKQIEKLRNMESNRYAIESSLRSARARSETAWLRRDYLDVVKSLTPIEKYLSIVEKNRLDYSRERLN